MNNCCVECFKDSFLRNIVQVSSETGDCNFCNSTNVKLYDLNNAEKKSLGISISTLVNLYEVADSEVGSKLIKDALYEDWEVFNLRPEEIQRLIDCESIVGYLNNRDVISRSVRITQLYDDDYMAENCIVRNNNWQDFTEIIKYKNRFHGKSFNYDAFASFISYSIKIYNRGDIMYRARISLSDKYDISSMGVPPKEKRMAGRVNPDGIGVLYLASEANTALSEVRASAFDFVTIGKFRAKEDLRVVDLSGLLSVTPFSYESESALLNHAINLGILKDIVSDIAKPMRRSDSSLEYLPTQYIAELIKSEGYSGVEYKSTIAKNGFNLAIFNEDLFECVETSLIEVEKLEYTSKLFDT